MTPERELLREIDEYLAELQDVTDGSYGEPHPNRAMSLIGQIDALLALPATQRSEQEIPLCAGCAQAWFTERNLLRGDHGCVVCAFLGNAAPLSEKHATQRSDLAKRLRSWANEACGGQVEADLLAAADAIEAPLSEIAPNGTAKVAEDKRGDFW